MRQDAFFARGGNALEPRAFASTRDLANSEYRKNKQAISRRRLAASQPGWNNRADPKTTMETYDPDAVLAERREAVLKTLRRVDAGEIRAFLDEIFESRQSHPWFKPFHEFVDAHAADTFLRAEPEKSITVIYHPGSHAGLWCRRGEKLEGVGRLHGRGLEAVRELSDSFFANHS